MSFQALVPTHGALRFPLSLYHFHISLSPFPLSPSHMKYVTLPPYKVPIGPLHYINLKIDLYPALIIINTDRILRHVRYF